MGQENFAAGIAAELNKTKQASDAALKDILSSWKDASKQMAGIGSDMAAGLAKGILDAATAAKTVKDVFEPATKIAKGMKEIFNEGNKTQQTGANLADVFAKGGEAARGTVPGIQAFGGALNMAMGVVGLVVMAVTTLVSIFQELNKADAAYQALADGAEDFKSKCEQATIAQQHSLDVTQAQGPVAQGLVDKIKGLTDAQGNLKGSQTECAQAVAQLNQMYPGLNLQIDESTGKLNMNASELRNSVVGMQEMAEAEARQSQYAKLIEQKTEAELNRKVALDKVKAALFEQGMVTEEQAEKMDEAAIAALAQDEALTTLGQSTGVLSGNTKEALDAYNDYNTVVEDTDAGIKILTDDMNAEAEAQAANTQAKKDATEAVRALTELEAAALIAKQENNQILSEEDANALEAWKTNNAEKYDAMVAANELEKELYDQKLSYTKDAFSNVQEAMNEAEVLSVQQMIDNLNANQEAMEAWSTNQKVLMENGLGGMIEKLSQMGPQGFAQAQYLVDQIEAGADMSELQKELSNGMEGLNAETQNFDYEGAYSASKGVGDQFAAGFAGNPAAIEGARNYIEEIGTEMQNAIQDVDFTSVGRGIIEELASGMASAKECLYSEAVEIAEGLKSRMKINGKVSAVGNGNTANINVNWYDKGGLFNAPQIIGIAERRPEFVGAAEDLESFISKAVNNSFVRIDPAMLHDIGSVGSGNTYGGDNIHFNPQVTVNTQKLTDAELRRATDFVSREFAKVVTSRKVGRI